MLRKKEMQDFLKAALQDQPGIGHGDLAQVFSSGGLAQVLISLPKRPVQKIMTDVLFFLCIMIILSQKTMQGITFMLGGLLFVPLFGR